MRKAGSRAVGLLAMAAMWWIGSAVLAAPIMVEKNLFAEDRKPPSEQANPSHQSNQPGIQPKAIQLDGVFIHGDTKKALVRLKEPPRGRDKAGKAQSPFVVVREGEKLADYQVIRVEPRSISLEKDGQTIVVGLFADGKVVPPPPPVSSTPGNSPPGEPDVKRQRSPGPSHGADQPEVTAPPRLHHRGRDGAVMTPPPGADRHTDAGFDETSQEEMEEDMEEDES